MESLKEEPAEAADNNDVKQKIETKPVVEEAAIVPKTEVGEIKELVETFRNMLCLFDYGEKPKNCCRYLKVKFKIVLVKK